MHSIQLPFLKRLRAALARSPAAITNIDREVRPLMRIVARRLLRQSHRRPRLLLPPVDQVQQVERLTAELTNRLLRLPCRETWAEFNQTMGMENRSGRT